MFQVGKKPRNTIQVLEINPMTSEARLIGPVLSGEAKSRGSVGAGPARVPEVWLRGDGGGQALLRAAGRGAGPRD